MQTGGKICKHSVFKISCLKTSKQQFCTRFVATKTINISLVKKTDQIKKFMQRNRSLFYSCIYPCQPK